MNPSHATIRAGLIGYGYAGKTFHAPLIRATDGLDLVAVSSSNAAKVLADLPQATVYDDAEKLIAASDIELVVVAAPNDVHAALASAALHAGKHVVIDKPFALDMAEARDLIALADRSPGLLSVFHNRRWDSDYLAVRQAVDGGLIGNVAHFESHIDRFRPAVRDRWRESAGPGAGIWYDLGPHLVDQALQLFGLPERVQAALAIQRAGGLSDDWAHVRLDYGQRQVILHASMLVAGGARRFIVHGDAGSLIKAGTDRQEAQLLNGLRPGAPGWGDDPDPLLIIDADGNQRYQTAPAGDQRQYYMQLGEAIRQRAPNPVPAIQALTVMAVLEAGFESSRTGCAATLALDETERARWESSV